MSPDQPPGPRSSAQAALTSLIQAIAVTRIRGVDSQPSRFS